jgi:Tfp pilus assembly protein PilO
MSTENNEVVSSLSSNSREASPPTAVIAKYIVIMLVVTIALVLFGVKPALEGYFNNNSKVSQQLTTNTMNQTTFDELVKKQNDLSKTKVQVDDFLKSFPANADQTAMLTELNKIASQNGVSITSIAPSFGSPTDKKKKQISSSDLVAPINIDMSLNGGDPNKFISDLERSSRVFVINSLSYTSGEKGATTMTIKATTYVVQPLANPNVAPPAGQTAPATTPGNTPAPADVPAPAPTVPPGAGADEPEVVGPAPVPEAPAPSAPEEGRGA